MEYRHFRYILKIAEEQSISLAAKKLYISQPSLSQLLAGVEKQLGAPLFDRSCSPLQPTYIGELYLRTARQILDLDEQLRQKADDVLHLKRGRLTIGSSPLRSTYLLPQFIPQFQQACPGIELILKESTTLQLEELAQSGEVDLVLSLLPIDARRFAWEPLFEERLLLALPPEHPLCARYGLIPGKPDPQAVIDLAELAAAPFILMHNEQKIHRTLFDLCQAAGFTPHIQLETRSMDTAQALAGAGMGATLLPDTLVRAKRPDKAPCYAELSTHPARTVILAWRRGRYLSHAARAFLTQLQAFCRLHE